MSADGSQRLIKGNGYMRSATGLMGHKRDVGRSSTVLNLLRYLCSLKPFRSVLLHYIDQFVTPVCKSGTTARKVVTMLDMQI